MTERVVDAFAILAWLQDEPGAAHVEDLLRSAATGQARLHISSINVGEVYYRLIKLGTTRVAEQFLGRMRTGDLPLLRVAATDARVDAAARLKANHAISYADAFAVALALERDVPLLTDDPEIVGLTEKGVVQVERLRS